ncbi:MAG: heavy metal-responsive transcriptional regulator [Acidobacteriia bacterium]|nr:heavy metal-responsive transcriptional regulator [Terriglobia bacterium]
MREVTVARALAAMEHHARPVSASVQRRKKSLDSGASSGVYTEAVGVRSKPALRSGDLAKLVGISPDTLRLYERKGLLTHPPRSANGYRCYPPEMVDRIRLIRAALSIGFTIDELAEILSLRDGEGVPCAHVRDLAATKLRNLERHMRELMQLREQLRTVLKQWDAALKKTPASRRAGLLEALAATSGGHGRTLPAHLYSSLARKSFQKE